MAAVLSRDAQVLSGILHSLVDFFHTQLVPVGDFFFVFACIYQVGNRGSADVAIPDDGFATPPTNIQFDQGIVVVCI